MDSGVESAGRQFARAQCEPRHLKEIRGRVDRAVAVQRCELGILAEAREHRLQSVELRFCFAEQIVGVARGDEELDVRAHPPEGALLHQEVLVTVSGGSVTMRTDGAWTASV